MLSIPFFAYNLSSSVAKQSNFTTAILYFFFLSSKAVLIMTEVFPDDGGPENVKNLISISSLYFFFLSFAVKQEDKERSPKKGRNYSYGNFHRLK